MKPRILLVEDDAVTRAFMIAALEALPAAVDAAASVADACAIAGAGAHDLWLFDANLPDGDGAGLLAQLRAAGLTTPALAHTAAREVVMLDALRAAGFVDSLVKPLTAVTLQSAVRAVLHRMPLSKQEDADGNTAQAGDFDATPADAVSIGALPIWDDVAALAALKGQSSHVAALRKLFLDDLCTAHDTIDNAARDGDVDTLRATLHRLYAGCGFVGAARLDCAARALGARPQCRETLAVFDAAAQATLSSP